MFYRVDYTTALLLGGFLLGLSLGKRSESTRVQQIAQAYYVTIAVLLGLRVVAFTLTLLTVHHPVWGTASGLIGDLSGVAFGALFGLAARRRDGRELLLQPAVLAALCLSTSFTFAMAGIGKAFSMQPMTEFFVQSGYSVTFLKFVILGEIFNAIGLLIPWAVAPALIGFTVDMFGAVLTHVHNHDPLNDSTGAIAMLIRLAAIAILWSMRPQIEERPVGARRAFLTVAAGAIVCLVIAACGSIALRHLPSPV